MKKTIHFFFTFLLIVSSAKAQDVFWFEDFDNGAATRWNVSGNDPTPAGIPGLVYGVNNNFDYFVINDANTPELNGSIISGQSLYTQGQFVQGHHYDCASPNNLPNPFVNTGAVNNSLHITAQNGCSGLIYGGTPGFDDWNCITITGNDFPLTQTEQFAAYNTNIDATGKCNIKLTADFFLGGSANGLEAHSTILYSTDGGTSWNIVQDNLATCFHTYAGTCNDWHRRTFFLPADADNQPDLRIAFRWTEDGNTNNNTQDYALGASFNVDNVMLSACNKPNADFSANTTNACKNETISLSSVITSNSGLYVNCFSILTDNCTVSAYSWNIPGATFVDGTAATDANPHIQFSANGTYTVELTASTCGGDSVVTKANYITIADCPPTANFSADQLNVCADPVAKLDTVSFTDLSTTPSVPITAWAWTFNPATVTFVNGTNASSQNPQLSFDAPGIYEVSLQVTSAEGVDSEVKTTYINAISCNCAAAGGGGPSVIWSEDFDGNGGAGSNWGTLNESIGAQGPDANLWYISDQEAGPLPPTCGFGGGGDQTLHLGSSNAGDIGAAYEIGCNPGCSFCDFFGVCINSTTNKRSQSQDISTIGQTGLTLNFNYIENGDGTIDDCVVEYSTNGGGSWTQLTNPAKTALTCAPQGTWTSFSIALPASCENIANLRIAFRWQNDADGVGTDPSFAVDDISITTASGGGGSSTTWDGIVSNDWHTAANWSSAAVPTSADDVLVPAPADLVGAFMPTIAAAALAKNVCNFGTITHTGNNTLTIDEDLLNEGVITTDNTDPSADVIFANAVSSYSGSGTMYDVDVAVNSSDLTFENSMTPRSFIVNTTGTVDLGGNVLSINKNLTKTDGTLNISDGEIHFIDACGSCVDASSNADVTLNANQTFGNVLVNKTAGVKTSLMSAVNHTFSSPKTLTIQSGILDANTSTVDGSGNLTMTGGEYQTAKCATVVPELVGNYTLPDGQVTLDGLCNQTIRVGVAGGSATVFSENFENPNIAAGANIVGNIAGWTETATTHQFINKETSGLNGQTATLSETFGVFGQVNETLSSPSINFGTSTANPQLTFDYEWVDLTGDVPSLQVLYKSAAGDPWTVGATFTLTGVHTGNVVNLAGASADFFIGFRVFFDDAAIGAAGGECSIDNIVVTGDGTAGSVTYHDVEFTGTGIKTLDNGNLNINNQLLLNLPTSLGNYVNTATDTCYVFNASNLAVSRTGGHIVGFLGRDINPTDVYRFDVGSDNAGADTYYEPIVVNTNSILGANNIVAKFFDATPNPTTVNNVTFLTASGAQDTVKLVETEGFWYLHPNKKVLGGNYQASVSPSNFWTLTKPWAQGYYALLKQSDVAQPWDFINGGVRVNDSTTTAFVNFSNYALAFTDSIVPDLSLNVKLVNFDGKKTRQGNRLYWDTEEESDSDYFELQRSADAINFESIAQIEAKGQSAVLQHYEYLDKTPHNGWNYYRLKQVDTDNSVEYSHIVALDNYVEEIGLVLLPNPARDNVTFDYIGAHLDADLVVEIFDVNGRRLFIRNYTPASVRVVETINTSELSPAVYFVRFSNGEIRHSMKLVITD